MKKTIYTFVLIISSLLSQAQCSKKYSATGIYPGSLPAAWEQLKYIQELDFTFPADTIVNGFSVHIDSMKVKSLSGFPGTNFNYTCGNSNCIYTPNTSAKFQGCFTISGTAPKGSAGSYKLYVDLEAYIQTPFGPQVYTILDSSVTFDVNVCSISTVISTNDTMICQGFKAVLSATGFGDIKWYLNNGLQDSGAVIQSGLTGNWMAVLTDSVGCKDTSNSINLGNYPAPARPLLSNTAGTNDITSSLGKNYIWKNNGVIDSSFSGKKTITITKDGYYQVSYQDSNGCWSAYSDSLFLKFAGISELNAFQADLYPNPAGDKLYISLSKNSSAVYYGTLVNLEGQTLRNFSILNNQAEINVSALPSGMYLLYIQGGNGKAVYKFSVSR